MLLGIIEKRKTSLRRMFGSDLPKLIMQKMKSSLSIGIAGAGTAGLAAAIALAKAGHQVEVFERHPSLAPLGAGLLIQPQGLRALDALGVRKAFDNVSVPIHRLIGDSHRGWRLVDINYSDIPARAVARAPLANVLFDAAKGAGVQFSFGCAISKLERGGAEAVVSHSRGQTSFDVFVLADGAASLLREQAALAAPATIYRWGALWGQFWVTNWEGSNLLQQRYRGTSEMMGLMPTDIGDRGVQLSFFWSLQGDQFESWRQGDLERWKKQVLALWPEASQVIDQVRHHSALSFASYRHTWPRALAAPPYCVIGDAAHAMSPQLGLGTTLAVQDALALARELEEKGAQRGVEEYARRRLRPSQTYQTLSRALTPCFQSSGSGLWRDLLFAAGRRLPGVQWLMKRSIAEPVA